MRVSAKEIENQPVTNVLSSVQGRMSGVSVTQNSGTPGGGFDIQIRGKNIIRREGNEPLYIMACRSYLNHRRCIVQQYCLMVRSVR